MNPSEFTWAAGGTRDLGVWVDTDSLVRTEDPASVLPAWEKLKKTENVQREQHSEIGAENGRFWIGFMVLYWVLPSFNQDLVRLYLVLHSFKALYRVLPSLLPVSLIFVPSFT